MKIGVTGSSGKLGRQLVKLLTINHEVTAFSRDHEDPNSEYWELSETPSDSLIELIKGIDVIFHCAAKIPLNFANYSDVNECLNINSLSVLNILEAAERAKVKKVVMVSGTNFIKQNLTGELTRDLNYDCSYAPAYFVSKAAGELFFQSYQTTNTRKLIVRLSSIYSEKNMPGLFRYTLNSLETNKEIEIYGEGSFKADYIHIDDAAWALASLGLSGAEGVINVGSGKVTSNLEIVKHICNVRGINYKDFVTFKEGNVRQNSSGFLSVKISKELKELNFRPKLLLDVINEMIK
jgi:UDP-glucose 4-epimerase